MRTCFFIATKTGTAGAALVSAPNLSVIQYPAGRKNHLLYSNEAGAHIEMLIHRVYTETPIVRDGSTWTFWLLIPVSTNIDAGPRAIRKLLRARLGGDVIGPMTPAKVKERRPGLFALLCPDDVVPHVVTGDQPDALVLADYDPTQEEADADLEVEIE